MGTDTFVGEGRISGASRSYTVFYLLLMTSQKRYHLNLEATKQRASPDSLTVY